ncbi:MAG: M2 family metallopeptidase [Planctomycetota bacterium]|nr:M2 family metallopeptidase [Planctomycetota bacterium]
MKLKPAFLVTATFLLAGSTLRADESVGSGLRSEVRKYLARYAVEFADKHRALAEARWRVATTPDDEESAATRRQLEREWASFVGSIENIELSRTFDRRRKQLVAVDQRQLSRIAFAAAGSPAIVQDLVVKRIDALEEVAHVERERTYRIDGAIVQRSEIERILREDRDLSLRRSAWESLHEAGQVQRPALVRLRWLHNEIVRSMGSSDAFAYRAREYGLTVAELQRVLEGALRELRPLQTELHTYLRFELARLFERPVPDLIPAHWLPGASGAEALVTWLGLRTPVSGGTSAFAGETALGLVERADVLWQSLGFAPLPMQFYERSLFDSDLSSSALVVADIDRAGDVRAIFDASPDLRGWIDAQQVVGRAHCALLAVDEDVPIVLRTGPNRAFHAALAGAVAHGARHSRSLGSAGVAVEASDDDRRAELLIEALRIVMPIAHSAGTLFQFERELYRDGIDPNEWNARWWSATARFEGIAPPAPRDERWCDPAAEARLFTAPAQGYDDAFAELIAFELYDHIARKLLDGDPRDVDIYGRKEVGDFVKSIARFGATVDWRTKLREKLGYEVSARPMVEYFEPLREWLVAQNQGRRGTLGGL